MAALVRYYMPHQVAERLLKEPGLPSLGGTRQEITILFVDLRNFTLLAESFPPDELINILNRHLSAIAVTALAHEGTLDKFMGDGAMILFNAPVLQPDHVARAVRAALEIRTVMENLTVLPKDQRLAVSVGIHTGDAVVGNIGSQELMNYTAIGDTVVLAKRLQEMAESGQILVSEEVYRQVKDIVVAEEVGMITVKGRIEPVHTYNILRLNSDETGQRVEERS